MQNLRNFLHADDVKKLAAVGGKSVTFTYAIRPVKNDSNDSIEAWGEFANALDWREWLNDEHWNGTDWDEPQREALNNLAQNDPVWSKRRLDNGVCAFSWQNVNPQNIKQAIEFIKSQLSDCEDEWEADRVYADFLGVDCWGMEKVGYNSYEIKVSEEAPVIGFDKFTKEQRLQIAVRAAGWNDDNVYNVAH